MLHLLLSFSTFLVLTLSGLCLTLCDFRLNLFFNRSLLSLFCIYSIIFTTPFISFVLLTSSHLPVNAGPDSGVLFALSAEPFLLAPQESLMVRDPLLFGVLEFKLSLLNLEVF